MAFSIGYVAVCDRNIQHLYTTTTLKQPAKRKSRQYKPEFLKEFEAQRKLRLNNRRFMEYVPKHEIELPRAPAFRNIPKGEVDGIVKRLTMAPSDRFNFKYKDQNAYNDWRSAREDKIQHLKETLKKFGGGGGGRRSNPFKEQKSNRKEKKHKRGHISHDEKTLPGI
ncbi:hypothetical protein ACF0H5_021510 [Mactra antiquata]